MQRFIIPCSFFICLALAAQNADALDEILDNFYTENFPRHSADGQFTIGIQEGEASTLFIHSAIFKKMGHFPPPSELDQKSDSNDLMFPRPEELSAFKKIIYILYQLSEAQREKKQPFDLKPFLRPDDLADFILLTAQYQVGRLGGMIWTFFYENIRKKISKPANITFVLDELTKNQFHHFYKNIFQNSAIKEPWFISIKDNIQFYIQHLNTQGDPRLEGLDVKDRPDILRSLFEIQASALNDDAKQLASVRAQEIFDQFTIDLSNENQSPLTRLKKYSYPVNKNIASQTLQVLTEKLPAYWLKLIPELHVESRDDLCTECCFEYTVGYCLARTLGWAICLPLYPIQFLTAGYFCCCCTEDSDESCTTCLNGTRLGARVSMNVYDGATHNNRWIHIKPKEDSYATINNVPDLPSPKELAASLIAFDATQTYDCSLEATVAEKTKIIIKTNSATLKQIPLFKTLLENSDNCETIPYSCATQEEASALEKIISFLDNKNIVFEPHDFTDLIVLAHKFEANNLGKNIAIFLHDQIKNKLNTSENLPILLDNLDKNQILHLIQEIIDGIPMSDPWLNNIKQNLEHYLYDAYLKGDSRVQGIKLKIEPNKRHIEAAKRRLKLKAQEFETKALLIASRISEQFLRDVKAKQGRKNLKKFTYPVPYEFGQRAAQILKNEFPSCAIEYQWIDSGTYIVIEFGEYGKAPALQAPPTINWDL